MGYYCSGGGAISMSEESQKKAVLKLFTVLIEKTEYNFASGKNETVKEPMLSLKEYQSRHNGVSLDEITLQDVLEDTEFQVDSFNDTICLAYDEKWHEETEIIGAIAEFLNKGADNSMKFVGEDGCHWKEIYGVEFPGGIKNIPGTVVYEDDRISDEAIQKAENILKDNGVEPDEVQTVLQAIGYALLDAELYPQT